MAVTGVEIVGAVTDMFVREAVAHDVVFTVIEAREHALQESGASSC